MDIFYEQNLSFTKANIQHYKLRNKKLNIAKQTNERNARIIPQNKAKPRRDNNLQ